MGSAALLGMENAAGEAMGMARNNSTAKMAGGTGGAGGNALLTTGSSLLAFSRSG